MVGKKIVNTVVLQPRLAERLSQVAEYNATTIEELINTAVQERIDVAARQKIHAENEAFRAMHAELLDQYRGKYVAVHRRKVVDHDEDLNALHRRIRRHYGYTPVLLREVTGQPELEFVFRSPRLEWLV